MPSLRRWLAVAILSLFTVYEAVAIGSEQGAMKGAFVVFTIAVGVATLGVARRAFWGRSLAMGIGVAGLLDVLSIHLQGFTSCGIGLFALMPAGVLLLLAGPRMAEFFGHSEGSKLWLRNDWRIRSLHIAIMAAVPMIAGLLRHAASNAWWIGNDDRAVAIGASLVIVGGAVAAIAQRTVGLFVMFAGACAALGLAFESMFRLHDPLSGGYQWIDGVMVEMSLTSILPSITAVFIAVAAFAPAMWRFLRDGDEKA